MLKEDYEIEKQEDEDLRCPICNYYFSSKTQPYLLPCNHNLCSACIESITKKNMYACPMCRAPFSAEQRRRFQINSSFLNLVTKILKTKVIYCPKCSKIFNWTEHHLSCDQSQFKETNEIFDELKTLIEECVGYLRNVHKTEYLRQKKVNEIYSKLSDYIQHHEQTFENKKNSLLENFFQNIPAIDIDSFAQELYNFIQLCEPLHSVLNLNNKELTTVIEQYENFKIHVDMQQPQKNKSSAAVVNKRLNQYLHNNSTLDSMYNDVYRNSSANKNIINIHDAEIFNSNANYLNATTADANELGNGYGVYSNSNNMKIDNANAMSVDAKDDLINSSSSYDANNVNFDKLNFLISIHQHISDIVQKITNHTRQIEYTAETIKSQINNNYVKHSAQISTDLDSIYDTVSVTRNNSVANNKHFIANYIPSTRKIWLFNILTCKSETIDFPHLPFKFNETISIEHDANKNTLYVVGGQFNQSISFFSDEIVYSDTMHVFPFVANVHVKDQLCLKMPRKRGMHSTLLYDNKLFIVGGETSQGVRLKECEFYNVKDKVWELMPNLNYGRVYPTLSICNESYLYVLAGGKEGFHHVEFINIHKPKHEWKCVKINDPGKCWMPLYKSGCFTVETKENCVFICGGCCCDDNNSMTSCTYIYNTVTKSVYRSRDLGKAACFTRNGLFEEESKKVYIIDTMNTTGDAFGIHIYDTGTRSWVFNS